MDDKMCFPIFCFIENVEPEIIDHFYPCNNHFKK